PVIGSRNDDRVAVDLTHAGLLVVKAGGETIGTFDPAAVGTIHFNGFAGDDRFTVDSHISVTVFADGGAGDDKLEAGGGGGVFLGNAGNDVLVGGTGRDILIGGDGLDDVFGTGNDDIAIGGTTAYDTNQAALMQLLGVWTGPGSYNDRVAAIRAGTGGVPKLDATSVFDDGDRDDLHGGPGLDWFF